MLTPANIREEWDSIKPALEKMRDKCGYQWRPEDIYADCVSGNAFLYTCNHGFVVFNLVFNEFTCTKELNIWIAHGVHHDSVITVYKDEIKAIAKEAQCEVVTFHTTRKGFDKLSEHYGWTLRDICYEWRIDDGK